MNKKLITWIIDSLESDSEILQFIEEENYHPDVCILALPRVKEESIIEILINRFEIPIIEELIEIFKYSHSEFLQLAFNRLNEHRKKEKNY